MNWKVFFAFSCSMCLANSVPGYHPPLKGSSVWGYFTPPLIHRVPSQSHKTAMEAMVDLTNNLGVAILQDHAYSRGNFAFSPYGVASVLVVLYEGARGESARQIHTAVGFPSDKDIIRIGFRDIHRHLRSYFSHEGYLSGISLNKDSSSLKPEYKKVLRFYGYDIDPSQSSEDDASDEKAASQSPTSEQNRTTVTSSSKPSTEKITKATEPSSIEEETKTTVQSAPIKDVSQQFKHSFRRGTEEPERTTTNAPAGTTKILSSTEREETESTTMLSITAEPQEEKTSATFTEPPKTDDLTIEKNSTSEGGVIEITERQEEELKKRKNDDEKEDENASEEVAGVSEMPAEVEIISSTPGTNSEHSSWETPVSEAETQRTTEDITSGLDNGMLIPQLGDTETAPTEGFSVATDVEGMFSLMTDTTTQFFDESENSTGPLMQDEIFAKNKVKKSRNTDYVGEDLSNRIRSIINTKVPLWLGENTKKPSSRIRRTLTDYLKSPYSPDLSLQLQNGMYDTHISRNADLYRSLPRLLFLVDGAVDTPVPMMTYTNVFPYAYIPRLHAKALEFPLDDIRYKLLILLPVERRGLRQLIYDLADFPLSGVLTAVQATRVKAMVPTFMVEGFVILTSSLQKLGIWDVFDPRKANLSAMSLDPELYVRNVEQSVTVVIRNYVEILDIQTRTMAARQMEHDFEVTHPFLYFVLDTATNTALMAGQILDPLNSRIY